MAFRDAPDLVKILQRLSIVESAQSGTFPDLSSYVQVPDSYVTGNLLIYDSAIRKLIDTEIKASDLSELLSGYTKTDNNFTNDLKTKLEDLPDSIDISTKMDKHTEVVTGEVGQILTLAADGNSEKSGIFFNDLIIIKSSTDIGGSSWPLEFKDSIGPSVTTNAVLVFYDLEAYGDRETGLLILLKIGSSVSVFKLLTAQDATMDCKFGGLIESDTLKLTIIFNTDPTIATFRRKYIAL